MLIDANGNRQVAPIDFGWYPLLNAYGGNVPLAADSAYTLLVAIDVINDAFSAPAPGQRPARTISAQFPPIPIAQDAVSSLPLATGAASANEAELLKPLNAALSDAITALWQQSVSGAEKPAGDYFVGYALDYAELALPPSGAKHRLKNLVQFTDRDEMRLALLVRDSRTGRLIAGLHPRASFVAANGTLYGPGEMPFRWRSWLTHYGRSDRIPRKGLYTLRVHFDAPGFRRWGRPEERYALPADVEFDKLSFKPEKETRK